MWLFDIFKREPREFDLLAKEIEKDVVDAHSIYMLKACSAKLNLLIAMAETYGDKNKIELILARMIHKKSVLFNTEPKDYA